MPNLNRVMLMGNLTRDPELRYTPNNQPVANLGLAVNRVWYDRNTNEKREETTFVDCEAWGRTAETLNQYLRKGRPVYLEGRLKLDQWQDQQGNNRSKMKVVVEQFQFIDSRGGGDDAGGGGYSRPQGAGARGGGSSPPRQGGDDRSNAPDDAPPDTHESMDSDDIPF